VKSCKNQCIKIIGDLNRVELATEFTRRGVLKVRSSSDRFFSLMAITDTAD